MTTILFLATSVVLLIGLTILWSHWRKLARAELIRTYTLPRGLLDKLAKKRPSLALKDRQLVARALRQFFLAYLKSGYQFVSMPSQLADDLWHEFILYTREYEAFCKAAFGRYLHHTPAIVLGGEQQSNAGLRRVWWYACLEENINPRRATRLPLLFAIDGKFGIEDGFKYAADCEALRMRGDSTVHCAGDFSSSGCGGGAGGFGEPGAGGSDPAGGSDGGCGGGGCGGGGD